MTLGNLVIKTGLFLFFAIILKAIFFGFLNYQSLGLAIFYYVIFVIVTIAIARRAGVLNYMEAFLLMIIWLIGSLIADVIITQNILGSFIFKNLYFWVSYPVFLLAVFIFHKKQHVETRKSMSS